MAKTIKKTLTKTTVSPIGSFQKITTTVKKDGTKTTTYGAKKPYSSKPISKKEYDK